jgi:energy-coupling factor transporter ATP-binding protein EcfA2
MIGYFDNCIKIAYSNIDKEEIDRINQICENHKKENEKLNNLFIVTYAHNYFSLKQSQINKPAIQIDRHYNNDFAPVAAEIENFLLEENKSGLIILHGKQGTGKTTYIRHLINLGKKRMIYMSGDLVDKLSDPSFITFIRQQKNSIFIVEDCEELLSSRNGSNRMNAGLVNILNISDGLLSDELCIKFICTFNAPLKDIDEALLRKGRLAARYEFKDLTTDKVNQLIKEEGLDIPQQTQPMTLAEIYNYEGMDFSLGRKRVGF